MLDPVEVLARVDYAELRTHESWDDIGHDLRDTLLRLAHERLKGIEALGFTVTRAKKGKRT